MEGVIASVSNFVFDAVVFETFVSGYTVTTGFFVKNYSLKHTDEPNYQTFSEFALVMIYIIGQMF